MPTIDCSLVSDGPSDAALLPMIRWAVAKYAAQFSVEAVWADLRRSRVRPRSLAEKITEAVSLYPCDILFVHRDAEGQPPDWRRKEIDGATTAAQGGEFVTPYVCVIPVRMQEAWLLLDPIAIRRAANNPNGRVPLLMPHADRIENIPDPKCLLYDLLRTASGLRKRRLSAFRPWSQARLVSEYICNMTVLRHLSAFQRFEADVQDVVARMLIEKRHKGGL